MIKFGQAVYNLIYPIGSIYLSVNSVNPSTLFGGTWVTWGSGRVPVGIDTADTDFNTVEKIGGTSTVSLSANQNGPHIHYMDGLVNSQPGAYFFGAVNNQGTKYENSLNTKSSGEGQAHENKMKYITCYMWKRTA